MRAVLVMPALALALLSANSLSSADASAFLVVVNDANPTSVATVADVARMFMKTARRWENGVPVEPVDQALEAVVRAQFSREVLSKTPGQLQEHWLRETFSGREIPPPIRGSDAAVVDYVRAKPGAIGYVSASTSLPPGVKALKLTR